MESSAVNDLTLQAKRCIDEYNNRYRLDVRYEDALEQIRMAIDNLSVTPRVRKVAVSTKDPHTAGRCAAEPSVSVREDASWNDGRELEYWLPPKRSRVDGSVVKERACSELSRWLPKNETATSSDPLLSCSFASSWFKFAQDKVWLAEGSASLFTAQRSRGKVLLAERVPDLYTFWVQYTNTKCWLTKTAGEERAGQEIVPVDSKAERMDVGSMAERLTPQVEDKQELQADVQKSEAQSAIPPILALYMEPAYTEKWLPKTCSNLKSHSDDYLQVDNQDFEVI